MSAAQDPNNQPHNSHSLMDSQKQSPPAFLDLADSASRGGSTDVGARVEMKRQEHERQRLLHRKMFENQMRDLEQQQQQELLSIPFDPSGYQQIAASAPTTPPRQNGVLPNEGSYYPVGAIGSKPVDVDAVSNAVGAPNSEKRKSVRYAPDSPEMLNPSSGFARIGHKSMPASRRTSAGEHTDELAEHLQNLSLIGERNGGSPHPLTPSLSLNGGQFGEEAVAYNTGFNAGSMLDQQLDQEMHNAMRNLPTPADDKFPYGAKVSRAALDLAQKNSDWPYEGNRLPSEMSSRMNRRSTTNPGLGMDKLANLANTTPLMQQGVGSRRGSPLSMADPMQSMANAARSVPGTPLNGMPGSVAQHLLKSGAATPLRTDHAGNNRLSAHLTEDALSASELQASLARLNNGQYDNTPLTFNSIQAGLDDYNVEPTYPPLTGAFDDPRFPAPGSGSSALNNAGARFGPGGARGSGANFDKPMGPGPKNGKRGEMDREYNRFAGTHIEDLVGEIASLCKDQHGCRYLQKKLEEGTAEHRDMIFRETFGHFADLMTDPFGNYLCQKLLEFANDEQRNLICESVAQDLVNISLNMHGTRAVQKMIDFLSTRRQIHSIIVALSLHVVVLIKDLNGNHVIQKCLNKLAPEDNQFIYNAVAANCVEVATHRHGCCVLQRCVDHASEAQRVQLVNEITYNALTLVQDPYGNYVVQYILDLNDNRFSDGVIRQFAGNVCALSVQKFSSNVIEKCVRVAEPSTRKMLVDEMLNRSRLEKLLRDSYGNYCVQTALDYCDPQQRAALVDGIRPVLPLIRNTPYGKRIQNKLQREHLDGFHGGGGGGYGGQGHFNGNGMGGGRGGHQMHMQHSGSPGADMYGAQNGYYGQNPSMQRQAIDPYYLQGAQGLGGQGGYAAYNNSAQFNNAGLNMASYQRQAYGYGGM